MAPVERPDWADGLPTEASAPAPAETEGVERPDWPIEPAEPAQAPQHLAAPNEDNESEPVNAAAPVITDEPAVVDPELLAEWQDEGGISHHGHVAQHTAQAVFDALPAEERGAFEKGFESLPQGAQTAVLRELANVAWTRRGPARPTRSDRAGHDGGRSRSYSGLARPAVG